MHYVNAPMQNTKFSVAVKVTGFRYFLDVSYFALTLVYGYHPNNLRFRAKKQKIIYFHVISNLTV